MLISALLTLIRVFGDEHWYRIKLVVIALLPTRHEESRVCGEGRGSEGMMEGGREGEGQKLNSAKETRKKKKKGGCK